MNSIVLILLPILYIFYVYFGYLTIMSVLSLLAFRKTHKEEIVPFISILIPAYNEESEILKTVNNKLYEPAILGEPILKLLSRHNRL